MPEELLEEDLYPLFGGYWGYRAAPLGKVIRHRVRIMAKKTVEARQNAEVEARLAEQE